MRSRFLNVSQNVWSVAALIGVLFAVSTLDVGCHRGEHLKSEELQAVASNVNRLEDNEWSIIAVSGFIVDQLHFERRPFITFDREKKQASGFNGCNNFFGNYEIDGYSLKFGPVAATRRYCEGTANEVEMKFMQALEKTSSWELKEGLLTLLDSGNVLARFTAVQNAEPAIDLNSMTFLSTWFPSGKVTLSRGEYREPAAPGSAAEIVVKLSGNRALGRINGREAGAVVLITDSGGSGTFYDLALLSKEAEGWVNTDTVFLGDRVKIQSIEIKNGSIIIRMIIHGPDDPMCCPTVEVVNKFTVQENKLVPAEETPSANNTPEIIGIVWKWDQTIYNNDTKTAPAEPDQYTLKLQPDGTVGVRADCNRGGGTYIKQNSNISIHIAHMTRALCPADSLEEEFLRNLAAAVIYFVQDRNLYLDLKFDSGTMKFSKK